MKLSVKFLVTLIFLYIGCKAMAKIDGIWIHSGNDNFNKLIQRKDYYDGIIKIESKGNKAYFYSPEIRKPISVLLEKVDKDVYCFVYNKDKLYFKYYEENNIQFLKISAELNKKNFKSRRSYSIKKYPDKYSKKGGFDSTVEGGLKYLEYQRKQAVENEAPEDQD